MEFDLVAHHLVMRKSSGTQHFIRLYPRSVADFYAEYMAALRALGIEVRIYRKPVEFDDMTPFDEDRHHASYDTVYVERFRRILIQSDRVFKQFRSRFLGKSSPVHFFWGSFDLAVTRFSGRRAPQKEGVDPDHPRGLLARGDQLRLLAGRPAVQERVLLCVQRPQPAGIGRRACASAGGALGPPARRVHLQVRGRARHAGARSSGPRVLPKRLRGRRAQTAQVATGPREV